jgi:hypothetical protein
MANVIPFPSRPPAFEDDGPLDLLTAVDVAIRDLRDISQRWDESARRQAEECRAMLESAFRLALDDEDPGNPRRPFTRR